MDGILNVLKPAGMTSFDVVGYLRSILKIKKIGHTGTLDPAAVGVLPICVGKATKAIEYLIDKDKVYRAELTLGVSTDTQDATGNVVRKSEVNASRDEILNAVKAFVGKYNQIPPMYSAIKVNGQKLYEIARSGIEIERNPREVEIYYIDIVDIKGSRVVFDVGCSKGTYIRTLCSDIGDMLGCGGHMSFLVRMKAGTFGLDSTLTLEEIKLLAQDRSLTQKIMGVDEVFNNYKEIVLSGMDKKRFMNGMFIDLNNKLFNRPEKIRVYSETGEFLALGEIVLNANKGLSLKVKKFFI
ncbi:MAG: tRNA pseudouridine(55) synthase TruB [Bacillota bacterium]